MSTRLLNRARIQAIGMVLIGILLGYAIASTWDRPAAGPVEARTPAADEVGTGAEAAANPTER